MEFGKTLREAREAKGYTVSQLAELTHIYVRTLEGLEAEDFSSIPAPIYGRGFVKLCCQHLGLEQQPMIEEFMAIFTGEKPAARPAVVPAPAPEPAPAEPEPQAAEPVATPVPDATGDEPVAAPEPPPPSPFGELFNQQPEPPAAPRSASSRFAPPRPLDLDCSPDGSGGMPAIPWRLVILAIVAIAILWGVFSGVRALYRSLSAPNAEPAAVETAGQEASGSGTAAKVPRTAKPVKPLYID